MAARTSNPSLGKAKAGLSQFKPGPCMEFQTSRARERLSQNKRSDGQRDCLTAFIPNRNGVNHRTAQGILTTEKIHQPQHRTLGSWQCERHRAQERMTEPLQKSSWTYIDGRRWKGTQEPLPQSGEQWLLWGGRGAKRGHTQGSGELAAAFLHLLWSHSCCFIHQTGHSLLSIY